MPQVDGLGLGAKVEAHEMADGAAATLH
jgi:hypothetical protein